MTTADAADDVVELDAAPSLAALYAKALRPTRSDAAAGLPATTVVRRDVAIDRDHVAAFAGVCGFRVTDRLPTPYLHLLGFPLSIHLMAGDAFPYPLLGTIHVHQRIVVHRPVTADDRVDVAVRLTDLRPHRSGVQFDAHTTVTSAHEVVWTGRSTYLRRGEELTADADRQDDPRPTDAVDAASLPDTARWRVADDTGRAYAAVSGDRNPIHLAALTARPLGFPRPIAHGMWTLARALAGLEGRLPARSVVDVAFGRPLPLPSTVTYATARRGDDWLVGVLEHEPRRPHLTGVVAPL